MSKHPDGELIARQAFAAGLRKPERTVHAPAEPEGRAPLTAAQLEAVVDALMADLEELAVDGWSGTELVSLVLSVAYRLFAAVDDPPAERARLWRELAAQIEAQLGAEVH